jgi:hypothetical protein
MSLFDFLRDPISLWTPEPGLKLTVDLEEGSCCGVRLGSRAASLAKLGPPSNLKSAKRGTYDWNPLGITACARKEILDFYCIMIHPLDDEDMQAFAGTLLRGGKPLDLGPSSRVEDVIRVLGEPWHVHTNDKDPDVDRMLYYERGTLEWRLEFYKTGTLYSIELDTPPALENPDARREVHCNKPWPPS